MIMHPLLANLASRTLWAMDPDALKRFMDAAGSIKAEMLSSLTFDKNDLGAGYDKEGSTAVIPVAGVLLKSGAWLYRAFGMEATDYSEISAALANAEADPTVSRIRLNVDSPGGQVSGIHAVADQLKAVDKPLSAHVQTLAASAAYWLASQADDISAARGSSIGSIGAYMVVPDYSEAAEQAGIKVHVISSGPHKGAGVPGAPITDAQLAEFQKEIDQTATEFVMDVALGRGVDASAVRERATGQVYNTDEALSFDLIDRVSADPQKEIKMSDALKSVAALVKEHPAHAGLITELAAAGKPEADIKAEVAKVIEADARAKLEADAKANADAVVALKADLAASVAKAAALEKDLADAKAKADAVVKLAAGAAQGSKVKADVEPPKPMTRDAFLGLSAKERAAYIANGGTLE